MPNSGEFLEEDASGLGGMKAAWKPESTLDR